MVGWGLLATRSVHSRLLSGSTSEAEETTSSHSDEPTLNHNLVFYFTGLLAFSVILDYIHRAEFRNMDCRCKKITHLRLVCGSHVPCSLHACGALTGCLSYLGG